MTRIFVVGIGSTRLGRHLDRSVKALTQDAVGLALADAGCGTEAIEAAFFANTRQGMMEGQNGIRGQCALSACGFEGIPIANVENACASSSTGVWNAFSLLRAGLAEVALVAGTEKMNYPDKRDLMFAAFRGGMDVHEGAEIAARLLSTNRHLIPEGFATEANEHSVFMDVYAAYARMHMAAFGTTQRQIAAAAAKNHGHSALNPLAQYRHAMTVEEVLADKLISWPLTRAMCAPISDGAAAAILCTEQALDRFDARRAVELRGIALASSSNRRAEEHARHIGRIAAQRAYAMAALGPEDMQVAEVHDASAFAEIQQIENLGLCAPGEGGPFTESGATTLGGRIPVNTSGGLVSKGHPVGATGLIQMHEIVTQLRGEAGARQVEGARFGVAENGGGLHRVEEAATVVSVFARHDA